MSVVTISRKELRRPILPRPVLITPHYSRITRDNAGAANCPKLKECLFSGHGPKGNGNENEI